MRSISARGVVSVTQNSALGQLRIELPSGSGPMIFSRSNSAFTSFTDRGNCTTNSLKNGPENARFTPGIFSSSPSAKLRLGQILRRELLQAFLAEQAKWIVTASAQSA